VPSGSKILSPHFRPATDIFGGRFRRQPAPNARDHHSGRAARIARTPRSAGLSYRPARQLADGVALEIQTFVKAVRVPVKSQRRPRQKAALTDERFQPSCRGRRRLVRRRGLSRTHRRILSTILVEERPSTRGIKTTRPPRAFTRSPPTTWSAV
jgi:hypothetical protein